MSARPQPSLALEGTVLFVVLVASAALRFGAAIADDDLILHSMSGDARGTVGWICETLRAYDVDGARFVFGDMLTSERIIAGPEPLPLMTWPWRARYVLAGHLVGPLNVYEAVIATFWVLNGLCAYALGRSVTGGRLGGLFVMGAVLAHENFDIRAFVHNGHASYWAALLTVLWTVKVSREPSTRNFYLLALFLALGLMENEYYGYYGGVFATAFLLTHYRRELRVLRTSVGFRTAAVCGALLAIPLLLTYPTLFLERPLVRLGFLESTSMPGVITRDNDFIGLSLLLADIPRLFAPGGWFPGALSGRPIEWEMTYRFGLLMTLFGVILYRFNRQRSELVVPFAVAAVVLVFFSLSGRYAISLAHVTSLVAPMLRVTTRALFFVDVTVFLAVGALLQSQWPDAKAAHRAALVIGAVLAIADLRPSAAWAEELPRTRHWEYDRETMTTLRNLPSGLLVTLPLRNVETDPPEPHYGRVEELCFHSHRILDVLPETQASAALARSLNDPSARSGALEELGVNYVRFEESASDCDAEVCETPSPLRSLEAQRARVRAALDRLVPEP